MHSIIGKSTQGLTTEQINKIKQNKSTNLVIIRRTIIQLQWQTDVPSAKAALRHVPVLPAIKIQQIRVRGL